MIALIVSVIEAGAESLDVFPIHDYTGCSVFDRKPLLSLLSICIFVCLDSIQLPHLQATSTNHGEV